MSICKITDKKDREQLRNCKSWPARESGRVRDRPLVMPKNFDFMSYQSKWMDAHSEKKIR